MVSTYHSIIGYPVSHCVRNIENELQPNFVLRVFSFSNMTAAGEKTLAHSKNQVTDLSTESGNLLKMAAKTKRERIWVQNLETSENKKKGGKGELIVLRIIEKDSNNM